MSLVITQRFVLGQTSVVSGNAGFLGYLNNITTDNVTATSSEALYPVTNLANPQTASFWQATSTAQQTITIDNGGQEIDFIGIARHNLNQAGLQISVSYDGSVVVPTQTVSADQVQMYITNTASPNSVTITISGATTAPRIAVLYVGKAITFQRNIYVGHTPITYARERNTIDGISQTGEYLGQIVLNEVKANTVTLQNLTPDWYRQILDPFFAQRPRVPAFFAWRPEDYPAEVGYVWIEGNPKPRNQRPNGMMDITFNLRGIA